MSTTPEINRIIRSQRKTVALVVTPDGELEVRAPNRLSRQRIEEIVRQKSGWIEKQQERARKTSQKTMHRKLTNGARLWYLGKSHPLQINSHGNSRVRFANGFHLVESALPRAEELLTRWYKEQSRSYIIKRVEYYADLYRLNVFSIRITSARTRWGSCSHKNALSFTWRLIMAPPEIIDYIVIHELAHTLEKNHSLAYWAHVERMLPDYKLRRTWLKVNGRLLDIAVDANEENLVIVKR